MKDSAPFAWPNRRLLATAVVVSLAGSFHFGYQLTVMNTDIAMFMDFVNDSYVDHYSSGIGQRNMLFVWPSILKVQTVGGVLGTLLCKWCAESLGRKRSLMLSSFTVIIGCILHIVAKPADSFELLILGRMVTGIATGLILGIQPLYLNEISPTSSRGCLSAFTAIFVELGFFTGSLVALPHLFGTADRWPLMFWTELAISAATLPVLLFLPESPKHSMAKWGDVDRATSALRFFGRSDVDTALADMEQDLRMERKSLSIRRLWRRKRLRRAFLLGIGVVAATEFCGINAISFFSTPVLVAARVPLDTAAYATVAVAGVSCLAAVVNCLLIDRIGRKRLLCWAFAALIVENSLFMLLAYLARTRDSIVAGYFCIAADVAVTFTFGAGPSALVWLITAEMMPQNARAAAHTGAMLAVWFFTALATLVFFPLEGTGHELAYLTIILPLIVALIYFRKRLPETKGKTAAEILDALGPDDHLETDSELVALLNKD